MKTTLLILIAFSFLSCGWFGRVAASVTGESESCIDGVKYIQFASGVTVKYTKEGKIAACD